MADTPAHLAAHPLPQGQRIIVTVAVMMAVLLQVLDTTIANVALPHMQGSLSASQDQITWVLTSFIVAAAIATPLTGWLCDRFGQKNIFLTAVAGFTLASVLCGLSSSLGQIVPKEKRLSERVFVFKFENGGLTDVTTAFKENPDEFETGQTDLDFSYSDSDRFTFEIEPVEVTAGYAARVDDFPPFVTCSITDPLL